MSISSFLEKYCANSHEAFNFLNPLTFTVGIAMSMKLSSEHRQQVLIRLYQQYLFGEVSQGQMLQQIRKTVLGLSQTDYAKLVGVSRRTLTDIEQDKGRQTQQIMDKVFIPLGLKSGLIPVHAHIVNKIFKEKE